MLIGQFFSIGHYYNNKIELYDIRMVFAIRE